MAENLDVSIFRNGDPIPEVKTAQEWLATHRSESSAWCYYNNDPQNRQRFGKLYNWYAVSDPRGLAPPGWHVPTDNEWQTLITECAGGDGLSTAFEELKKVNGFAAKAAGAGWFKDASFKYMGKVAFWWSASPNGAFSSPQSTAGWAVAASACRENAPLGLARAEYRMLGFAKCILDIESSTEMRGEWIVATQFDALGTHRTSNVDRVMAWCAPGSVEGDYRTPLPSS